MNGYSQSGIVDFITHSLIIITREIDISLFGAIKKAKREVRLQVRASAGLPLAGCSGRYINVQRCGGLSMVLLQLKDPLELFMKRREFLAFRF